MRSWNLEENANEKFASGMKFEMERVQRRTKRKSVRRNGSLIVILLMGTKKLSLIK